MNFVRRQSICTINVFFLWTKTRYSTQPTLNEFSFAPSGVNHPRRRRHTCFSGSRNKMLQCPKVSHLILTMLIRDYLPLWNYHQPIYWLCEIGMFFFPSRMILDSLSTIDEELHGYWSMSPCVCRKMVPSKNVLFTDKPVNRLRIGSWYNNVLYEWIY